MSNTELAAARTQYRNIRAASRLPRATFDQRAQQLAHELADGEDVLPCHWLQAAREIEGV
jgi:hypothetical protein